MSSAHDTVKHKQVNATLRSLGDLILWNLERECYTDWAVGCPAILANEDWTDRNPNYHTANDQLQYLNLPYFTNFVKASVGTIAHLAYLEAHPSYLPLVLKEWLM